MSAEGKGWRPFTTLVEHDTTLIDNWNDRVKPTDEAWILGDVGFGSAQSILTKVGMLNGRKHLIAGNHDEVWDGNWGGHHSQSMWMEYFESIHSFARFKVDNQTHFMMSHFPHVGDHREQSRYDQYRLRGMGQWLVCGHVHDLWKINGRQINVGVDVWDFKPVHLDEITTIMRAGRAEVAA